MRLIGYSFGMTVIGNLRWERATRCLILLHLFTKMIENSSKPENEWMSLDEFVCFSCLPVGLRLLALKLTRYTHTHSCANGRKPVWKNFNLFLFNVHVLAVHFFRLLRVGHFDGSTADQGRHYQSGTVRTLFSSYKRRFDEKTVGGLARHFIHDSYFFNSFSHLFGENNMKQKTNDVSMWLRDF